MNAMRRYAYAVFGVACTHLVFGAIVRISGSGMGCGPHWPKCYGYWFPPFSRMDLVIEVLHRYLASVLLLALIALVLAAWRRRGEPGVGGRGGVLRAAALAMALGFGAALLGAVTVKLGNSAPATVAHWTVAMSLVAAVTAAVIRAGGLGGASARRGGVSAKTRRGTLVAAGLALLAVVMGGLTAKVQGGPVACLAFPLCGANPEVPRGAVHVQSTHRVIAVLLVLHLVGLFFALRKRREAPVIRRATSIALALGVLQLLVAGAMIGMHLPPVLRSLHEAFGVSIWIAAFALAYLSRLGSDDMGMASGVVAAPVSPAEPIESDAVAAASLRAPATGARPTMASALPAPASASLARATPERPFRAVEAAHATPSRSSPPPVLDVAPVVGRYLPTAAPAAAIEPMPRATAGPRRMADDPIELTAARDHGSRAAVDSALAFARLAADVAVAASHDSDGSLALEAVPEPPRSAIAAAIADVSEVDYADVVDVEVLDVVGDVGVSARDAGIDALTCATMPGARPDDLVASLVRTLVVATAGQAPEATSAERAAAPSAAGADAIDVSANVGEPDAGPEAMQRDDVAEAVMPGVVLAAAVPATAMAPVAVGVSALAMPADAAAQALVDASAAAHAPEVTEAVAAPEAVVGGTEPGAGAPPHDEVTVADLAGHHRSDASVSESFPESGEAAPQDVPASLSPATEVDARADAEPAAGELTPGDAPSVGALRDGSHETADTELAAASELNGTGGPPPVGEATTQADELPHEFAARVTIFDAVAHDETDDGLYNLVDEDQDDDELLRASDDVLSLDEEFSRLTLGEAADEYEEAGAEAALAATAPAVARAAPAPLTALSSLAALRRPAMAHSVAVIVARGADF